MKIRIIAILYTIVILISGIVLWNKIDKAVSDIIDTVSLQDMVEWKADPRIDIL